METQSKMKHRQADLALAGVDQSIIALFNRAPVMMHSLQKDGTIAKVNRRWLKRMGYSKQEVLGRKSTDFLTEPSRVWAIRETLPLFWQVGVRSKERPGSGRLTGCRSHLSSRW